MTDNMSHFLYHQNILVIYTIYTHTKKLRKYMCLYGDKSVFNVFVGKRYFELKNDLNRSIRTCLDIVCAEVS